MNDKLEKFENDPFDLVQEYIFNKCKDELSYIRTEFMKWKNQIDELKQINVEISSILNAEIENSRNMCQMRAPSALARVPNAPPSSPHLRRLSWNGSNKQLSFPKPFRPESALATHGARRKRPDSSRKIQHSSSSNEDACPDCIYEADNEVDECKDCAFSDQKPLSSDAKELLGDEVTTLGMVDEDASNDSESGIVQSSDSEVKSDEEKQLAKDARSSFEPKSLHEADTESSVKSEQLSDDLEDANTLSSRPNSPDHKPTVVECNDCCCKNETFCYCKPINMKRVDSYVENMNSRRLSLIHMTDLKFVSSETCSTAVTKPVSKNVITRSFGANNTEEFKIKFSVKIKKVGVKKQKIPAKSAPVAPTPAPTPAFEPPSEVKPVKITIRQKSARSDSTSGKLRGPSPVLFDKETLHEITNRGDDLLVIDEESQVNHKSSGVGNKKLRFNAAPSIALKV